MKIFTLSMKHLTVKQRNVYLKTNRCLIFTCDSPDQYAIFSKEEDYSEWRRLFPSKFKDKDGKSVWFPEGDFRLEIPK